MAAFAGAKKRKRELSVSASFDPRLLQELRSDTAKPRDVFAIQRHFVSFAARATCEAIEALATRGPWVNGISIDAVAHDVEAILRNAGDREAAKRARARANPAPFSEIEQRPKAEIAIATRNAEHEQRLLRA